MENTDIVIENSTATWRMENKQGEFGGTYSGTFKFRVFLSPTQQLQAGREYREFLGQYSSLATTLELNLAFALTQLKYRILSAPPFWTSTFQDSGMDGNIKDYNIIYDVLDAATRAQEMFKKSVEKERKELLEESIKSAETLLKKQTKTE
jgi:hypothetical protein